MWCGEMEFDVGCVYDVGPGVPRVVGGGLVHCQCGVGGVHPEYWQHLQLHLEP